MSFSLYKMGFLNPSEEIFFPFIQGQDFVVWRCFIVSLCQMNLPEKILGKPGLLYLCLNRPYPQSLESQWASSLRSDVSFFKQLNHCLQNLLKLSNLILGEKLEGIKRIHRENCFNG